MRIPSSSSKFHICSVPSIDVQYNQLKHTALICLWGSIVAICMSIWYNSPSSVTGKILTLYIDVLVYERRNSNALAMELRLPCLNPSICSLPLMVWLRVSKFIKLLAFSIYHQYQLQLPHGPAEVPLMDFMGIEQPLIWNLCIHVQGPVSLT